jgi:hypothetical protein
MNAIILILALAIRPDCDIVGSESVSQPRQAVIVPQQFNVADAIDRSINQAQKQNVKVQQTVRVRRGLFSKKR